MNTVYVRAESVRRRDCRLVRRSRDTVDGASVTTAADLAERVSGTLVDAKNLPSKLGTALAIVALLAAFLIASLLTLSSVAKRIREFGTLKALGWSQWLVVRQVTGESLFQGLLGGAIGVCLGIAGAARDRRVLARLSTRPSRAAPSRRAASSAAAGRTVRPGPRGRAGDGGRARRAGQRHARSWPRSDSPSSADSSQERSAASAPRACALPMPSDTSTEVMTIVSENGNEFSAAQEQVPVYELRRASRRAMPWAAAQVHAVKDARPDDRVRRRGRDRRAERFRQDDAPAAPRRPRPPVGRKRPLRGQGHGGDG